MHIPRYYAVQDIEGFRTSLTMGVIYYLINTEHKEYFELGRQAAIEEDTELCLFEKKFSYSVSNDDIKKFMDRLEPVQERKSRKYSGDFVLMGDTGDLPWHFEEGWQEAMESLAIWGNDEI